MAEIFQDKKAESTPLTIALVLGILIIFSVMAEFFRLGIIVQGVRDTLQTSVISVATSNYNELYNGLREGYSGGYALSDERWLADLDYYDIYARMDEVLGTEYDGLYHTKISDDGYEYRFYNMELNIVNPALAPESTTVNFKADAFISIEIPLSFGWALLPPLELDIRTKSSYMPKF